MPVTTRRVLLAKPRGYCAGVDRAVQAVEMALERYGAPVYVRKQIVHNTHVVRELETRGAIFVEEAEGVPEGAVVVFSAHGISPEVREEAKRRNLRTIDATCPLVTKVHNEAKRFAAQDYDILLIGHENHEEVVGTTGRGPGPDSPGGWPRGWRGCPGPRPGQGGLAVTDHAVRGRDPADRGGAARAVPESGRPAQ